ncbi:MAG: hypothetical protein OEZ58_09130 [Gammaproteobacteria bacterium]|nr:hypothetical protein [Gammaproteobacteria bacterium]
MKQCLYFSLFFLPSLAIADAPRWSFITEAGALYQSVSDVQIPPKTGTRFSLIDAVGNGPLPYARMEALYRINGKHGLRLLIAPLAIEEQGQLNQTVIYHGNTFAANTDTTYRYQFNSYRLSYAYQFYANNGWQWHGGFTGKIRHAEIALTQGTSKSSFPDLGFVPLLHVAASKQFTATWQLLMDMDYSWSPYGRALDLGLFIHHQLNKHWSLGGGYRTVEGGADVDVVYNFAWLHYAGMRVMMSY